MRHALVPVSSFIVLLSIFSSCQKQTEQLQYPAARAEISTHTVTGRDSVLINLTIESGHKLVPEIIMAPKHAKSTRIEREPSTGWLLYWYQSADGFKGVDSVEFNSIEPWMKSNLTTKLFITVR